MIEKAFGGEILEREGLMAPMMVGGDTNEHSSSWSNHAGMSPNTADTKIKYLEVSCSMKQG